MTDRARAISLLETVIAIFVLLGVLTFTLTLYSRSLGSLNKVERNALAASFADNVLSELRVWAASIDNFKEDTWTDFDEVTDADYPRFTARVRTGFSAAMAPCTDQQKDRPADRQVRLDRSLKAATIAIFYDDEPLFEMTALLSEPKRELDPTNPVIVEPVGITPSPLAPEATHRFTARLVDSDGEEIEDVKFSYSVQAVTGNGTVTAQSPDGSWGELTNVYIVPPGDRIYTGGDCRVVASATYFGQRINGVSALITLAKP